MAREHIAMCPYMITAERCSRMLRGFGLSPSYSSSSPKNGGSRGLKEEGALVRAG